MAMVVKNNMSAISTLNTLNKNSSEMANALKKVSSGMKVNGAGDDASAYSISEKLRVRIRSLGQCENNTEAGKSMLKTAERAVNEQIDITKRLKENAIKSANDTCTDDDRKIIQKETNHLLMQMNNIAYETNYNGIQLLAGRELGTMTVYFDPGAPAKQNNVGINVFPTSNGGVSDSSSGNLPGYTPGGPSTPSDRYTFSLSGLSGLTLPNDLDGQGFSILCSAGCGQFNAFQFDAKMPAKTGAYYPDANNPNGAQDATVIGIQGLTTTSDIEDAIFEAIRTTHPNVNPSTPNSVTIGNGNHSTRIEKTANGYELVRDYSDISSHFVLYNGFKGEMVAEASYHPWENRYIQGDPKSSAETRIQLPNTTLNILFPAGTSDYEIDPKPSDYPQDWPSDFVVPGSADFEYYDKKYGCHGNLDQIRREKWQDEVWPYPRRGASATGSCLTTIQKANKFLGDVGQALKYLVNCATNLGSQCQRMDVMNANLVTSDEGTQAAESLIRDADMAKEMVNYTKHNILSQTAQSALSQANQTSSGVLNILQ